MAGDFEREKEKSGTEGLGQDHTREDPQILLWWQRRKRNSTGLRSGHFGGRIDSAVDGFVVGVGRSREVASLNIWMILYGCATC